MLRSLQFAFVLAITAALGQASVIVSCSAVFLQPIAGITRNLYSTTGPGPCNYEDPSGAYARASGSESFGVTAGIFTYTAHSDTIAHNVVNFQGPPTGDTFVNTVANAEINNSFGIATSGPVRPGFLSLSGSAIDYGIDSGITWGGIASYSLPQIGFARNCVNPVGCLFVGSVPAAYLPVTLGQTLPFQIVQANDSSSFGLFGNGDGTLMANLSLKFFEADGSTLAPVTSAVSTVPEPASIGLLVISFLGACLMRRKLAARG